MFPLHSDRCYGSNTSSAHATTCVNKQSFVPRSIKNGFLGLVVQLDKLQLSKKLS